MKIKTSDLIDRALNWAVCKAEGDELAARNIEYPDQAKYYPTISPSTNWYQGGMIIERENITIIRADDDYEKDDQSSTGLKRVPVWFAECDQWVGHSTYTSYEGNNMEPTFMIGEGWGYYGPTPLIAAMRAYVAYKLGDEVDIPDELIRSV